MSDKWEYADTEDGAIVITDDDANPQSGKGIIYMNDDHDTAKLIAKAPEMQQEIQRLESELGRTKKHLDTEIEMSRELATANAELRREVSDLKLLRDSDADEKHEWVRELVLAVREVYAIAGEDKQVNEICNRILENSVYQRY